MKRIKGSSTRKSSAKEVDYLPYTRDEVGRTLLAIQAKVFKNLNRFARGDRAGVEDAVAFGMAETIASLAIISADPEIPGATIEDKLEAFMLTAAKQEFGRVQRRASKTYSLDAPLGNDPDNETFSMGSILAYRSDSPIHMENHADAMKAVRAAICLQDHERETLMGMVDGRTAEQCAKSERVTPGEIRLARAKMLARLKEVWGRT